MDEGGRRVRLPTMFEIELKNREKEPLKNVVLMLLGEGNIPFEWSMDFEEDNTYNYTLHVQSGGANFLEKIARLLGDYDTEA